MMQRTKLLWVSIAMAMIAGAGMAIYRRRARLCVQPILLIGLLTCAGMAQPSEEVSAEIEAAKTLWNSHFGHIAQIISVESGGWMDDARRQAIRSHMTDPVNIWMLTGELTRPETLRLARLAELPPDILDAMLASREYQEYVSRISSLIDRSDWWFSLRWCLPSGECVETFLVADNARVLYNVILSESFYVERIGYAGGTVCVHAEARNFFGFGFKVGEVIVEVIATCDPFTGCLVGCDHRCVAWVWRGTVERNNCSTGTAGQCCVLTYDVVVRGGLWVRIGGIPIGIGSTFSINGTCRDCCACRPRPIPAPNPVIR